MLADLLYIVLGVFDVLAVFVLIFKIYRLPFLNNLSTIVMFCIVSSVISYIIRIKLQLSWMDLPILIVMLLLFFRYILKVKMLYASLIVSAGINAYVIVQLLVIILFTQVFNFHETVVIENQSVQIQIIQFISIICAYFIGLLMYRLNLGFSFIPVMPHEFSIATKYKGNQKIIFVAIIGLVFLSIALTLLVNLQMFLLIPASVLIFAISYYFSNQKDASYD